MLVTWIFRGHFEKRSFLLSTNRGISTTPLPKLRHTSQRVGKRTRGPTGLKSWPHASLELAKPFPGPFGFLSMSRRALNYELFKAPSRLDSRTLNQ